MDINPRVWPKAFGEALRTVCLLPPSLFLSLSSILRDAAATADIVVSRAKMSICVCLECVSAVPAHARLAESSDCKPCHPALRYSGKASCKESHVRIHPMSPRGSGNKNIGTFIFLLRDLKILDLVLELIKASTCLPAFKVS